MKNRGTSAQSAAPPSGTDKHVDADDVLDDGLKGAILDALDDEDEDDEDDAAAEGAGDDLDDADGADGEAGGEADDVEDDDNDGTRELEDALGLNDTGKAKGTAAAASAATGEAGAAGDAAEPITRADGAVWNAAAKRWTKDGAFVEGEAPAEGTAGAAAGGAAGDAAAAGAAGKEGAAGGDAAKAPTWTGYSVKLDGKDTSLEEVSVSKANGHTYLAIPDAKFARFEQRLSRGAAGERMWRQLDQGLRELEALKAAPARKSDLEIEAEVVMEVLKPALGKLFVENEDGQMVPFLDARDMELLEHKSENAKMKAVKDHETSEAARVARAAEPSWEDSQANLIVDSMVGLLRTNPALAGMSREEIEEVYQQELLPIRNGLVWKEGTEVMGNTKYIYDRLLAKKNARSAAGAGSGTAPGTATGSAPKTDATAGTGTAPAPKPATPAKAGHSQAAATKGTKTDQADRFNRGVDAAPKPRSTSVKGNRPRPGGPSAATRTDKPARQTRRSLLEEQAETEDELRRTQRAFMSSDGFDFDDANDGE